MIEVTEAIDINALKPGKNSLDQNIEEILEKYHLNTTDQKQIEKLTQEARNYIGSLQNQSQRNTSSKYFNSGVGLFFAGVVITFAGLATGLLPVALVGGGMVVAGLSVALHGNYKKDEATLSESQETKKREGAIETFKSHFWPEASRTNEPSSEEETEEKEEKKPVPHNS